MIPARIPAAGIEVGKIQYCAVSYCTTVLYVRYEVRVRSGRERRAYRYLLYIHVQYVYSTSPNFTGTYYQYILDAIHTVLRLAIYYLSVNQSGKTLFEAAFNSNDHPCTKGEHMEESDDLKAHNV